MSLSYNNYVFALLILPLCFHNTVFGRLLLSDDAVALPDDAFFGCADPFRGGVAAVERGSKKQKNSRWFSG